MNRSRFAIFFILLLLIASCASLDIPAPDPDVKALLVLPVQARNTSFLTNYGFYSKYEIASANDSKVVSEAVFKFPNKRGFILIDSLRPGNYYVSSLSVIPVGSGDRTYRDAESKHIPFSLEFGSITILQSVLNVSVIDHPTQQGYARFFSEIAPLSSSQKKEILAELNRSKNIDKWKVPGIEQATQVPEGLLEYLDYPVIEFRAFAVNTATGRWGASRHSPTPKQAMDEALSICEKTGEKCAIYALGDTVVFGMSPAELLDVAEKYYFSISPAMAQINEDLLIGLRLSSKEITAYLSDKSVRGSNANLMKYKGAWQSNGVMTGEATWPGKIERARKDMGTWAVENGKLCRQWAQWSGGRRECLIITWDGNTLRAYDNHGNVIEEIVPIDNY